MFAAIVLEHVRRLRNVTLTCGRYRVSGSPLAGLGVMLPVTSFCRKGLCPPSWDHAAAFPSSSGVVPLGCQVRLGALHPSRPGGLAVLDCLSSTRILRNGCALSAYFRARRRLPRTVAAVLPLGLPAVHRFVRRLLHCLVTSWDFLLPRFLAPFAGLALALTFRIHLRTLVCVPPSPP